MRPKRTFVWIPDHEEAFRWTKKPLSSFFNSAIPAICQTDVLRLYASLLQCGSRFLIDTETRHAVVGGCCLSDDQVCYICVDQNHCDADHHSLFPIITRRWAANRILRRCSLCRWTSCPQHRLLLPNIMSLKMYLEPTGLFHLSLNPAVLP